MEPIRCCRCESPVRLPDNPNSKWVQCPHCRSRYPRHELDSALPRQLIPVPGPEQASPDSSRRPASAATTVALPAYAAGSEVGSDRTADAASGLPVRPGLSADRAGEPLRPRPHIPSPGQLYAARRKQQPVARKSAPRAFAAISLACVATASACWYGGAAMTGGNLFDYWLIGPSQSQPAEFTSLVAASSGSQATTQQAAYGANADLLRNQNPSSSAGQASSADASGSPHLAMLQLRERLRAATFCNDELQLSAEWTTAQRERWQLRLSQLAQALTLVDAGSPNAATLVHQAEDFLLQLASDPRRRQALLQPTDVAADVRPGVLICGQVVAISAQGQLFETTIQTSASGAVAARTNDQTNRVVVLSRRDPQTNGGCRVGRSVLVAGTWVAPGQQVADYQGQTESVVLAGLTLAIP